MSLLLQLFSLDVLENSKSDPRLLLDTPDMTCISCSFHRVISPMFRVNTVQMKFDVCICIKIATSPNIRPGCELHEQFYEQVVWKISYN